MGIVKERVAIPNFDSLLPTLKSPKEVKDILIKNNITGKDDLRPMLSCVYFDENGLAVAADTHKLVCVKYDTKEKQFKPFEGKCVNNEMGLDYKSNLGGCEIDGVYLNYPAVFPEFAYYKVSIEITRGILLFLKNYINSRNLIYVKQGDFNVKLNINYLYRVLKALYELGEEKIEIYAIDRLRGVSFVGKTTKSLVMPVMSEKSYEDVKETFSIDENIGIKTLVINDFDTFQKEFREGKYNTTATKEKKTKSFSESDIFIQDERRIVTQNDEFTAVSDGECAWIEKGEGGMGIEGLIEKCIRLLGIPEFFMETPEKLFELNIKEFVKGFEDYYKAYLERQKENYYKGFLGRINEEHINDERVYIPKNYEELNKVRKDGFYSMFLPFDAKPQRYTFTKAGGENEQCFVGITIDDKTMWQKPQNLKKLLGVFTKLGYDVVYVGIVYNMQKPTFCLESRDGKYRLIVGSYENEHTGENRDYIKKFTDNGISYKEIQSEISNFDVMLKMFEENGIQTEFVDTDEEIIERLKKEGHSDENINFSMQEQESLELDDEDNEPKQGTLNFGFWEEQAARSITNEAHTPIISEYQGKIEAYNDIVWWIESDKNNSFMDDRQIVNSVLSYAKKMALIFEEYKAKAEQDKSSGYENVLKELTKKN